LSMVAQSGHLVEAYVDGECLPKNPGGVPVWGFLLLRDNIPIDSRGGLADTDFSPHATDNVAEYEALINVLKRIKRLGWDRDKIVVYTDSQRLQNQLKEHWRVSSELLRLFQKAKALTNGFPFFEVRRIPRAQNQVAHRATRAAYYEERLAQLRER
jgi:ribonuclease HI